MPPGDAPDDLAELLEEQAAYYRALAPVYEAQALSLTGRDELLVALEAFGPTGDVLELACGPGVWTGHLLASARHVTAVDASPEMLALAAARHGGDRVRFVEADVFTWTPDRRYDVVFFGFWLSHVPLQLFDDFWSRVGDSLRPDGRVLFIDDAYRTPDELIEGEASSVIRRRLSDGSAYRAVKVPHEPAALEQLLLRAGWCIRVSRTSGPFYWGSGTRAHR